MSIYTKLHGFPVGMANVVPLILHYCQSVLLGGKLFFKTIKTTIFDNKHPFTIVAKDK